MILQTQSIVLLVCNLIIFVLVGANVLINKKENAPSWLLTLILLVMIVLPIMIVQVYSLDCMFTGDCRAWSWTLATAAIVVTLIYIVGFISMIIKLKKSSGPTKRFITEKEEENDKLHET